KSGRDARLGLRIVGIYETVEAEQEEGGGSPASFNPAGNKVFVPLSVAQALNDTPGYVELGAYYLESADQVSRFQEEIREWLEGQGLSDRYELATDVAEYHRIADPLQKVKRSTAIGLVGSLVACALVILLAMAMIVNGRRRELGVLKALGASDSRILLQLGAEVMAVCLVAVLLASGASALISQKMGDWLSSQEGAVTEEEAQSPGPGQVIRQAIGSPNLYREGGRFAFYSTAKEEPVELDVIFRGGLLLYGALIFAGVVLLGLVFPVVIIARLRPAAVLSTE
ncbi:MAG: ABC transporter permease, partial [Candidatus Geothermincolales bacterium]